MTARISLKHTLPMKRSNAISLFCALVCLFHISCSTEKKQGRQEDLESIAIMGTNDLHGTLAPLELKSRENPGVPGVHYESGGLAYLASYVKILRKEFGDHFIWLDAGDQFQGSIESNLELGSPMVSFFNEHQLNASAVGNHEFDFGLAVLKKRMTEAKYPYLAANIRDRVTQDFAEFPNTYKNRVIQAGRLKVGIIGLSTVDTPIATRAHYVKDFQFADLVSTTLQEATDLRKQGAHIILLVAHAGLNCDLGRSSLGRSIRKQTDPQGVCRDEDEIVQLLQKLPPQTVDAVVSGHTHQIVHHWIAGVPVIQGGAFGKYFNVVYLSYDWEQKRLNPDLTRIEGPIPVCRQVFQNQNDCNGDRPAPKNGRGPLIPYKFHSELIQRDEAMQAILDPFIKKTKLLKERVLSVAARPIEYSKQKESELGNLVADAIRTSAKTDFAYMNPGGIRTSLEAGPITYGAIYQVLPFENTVSRIRLTAEELERIIRVAQNGARGFGSVSGLKLKLLDPKYVAPFSDVNHDGRIDPWESSRMIEMRLPNGEKLDPDKMYTLAISDFLVTGGDDLKWAMSLISPDHIEIDTGMTIRESVIDYLEKVAIWNTPEAQLIDPNHPRLQFVKQREKQKRGLKRRHSTKKRISR